MVKFPNQSFGISHQMQFLIRLISADDLKGGIQIGAILLLQKKSSIGTTKQASRAGDHFKLIPCLLLSRVMYQQQTHAALIGKLFQLTDDLIIISVAISISADLTDLLQSVDDNESGIRMFLHELLNLFIQSCTDLLGLHCEMELIRTLYAKHA